MKNLLAATFTLFLLTSCGSDTEYLVQTKEVAQQFEGGFNLPNGGYIEIKQGFNGLVEIESSQQKVFTINPENNTLGSLPRISERNLMPYNDTLYISKDLNYKTGNDIEEDESGDNIRGKKKTDIELKILDGKLSIKFKIFSGESKNNPNFIIVNREILSL